MQVVVRWAAQAKGGLGRAGQGQLRAKCGPGFERVLIAVNGAWWLGRWHYFFSLSLSPSTFPCDDLIELEPAASSVSATVLWCVALLDWRDNGRCMIGPAAGVGEALWAPAGRW